MANMIRTEAGRQADDFGIKIAENQEVKSEFESNPKFTLKSSKTSKQKTRWQKVKLFGFTLAEVLITLGIIGVVASMTIPTLMNNTNDKELKTAWKKIFSEFSNATLLIARDNAGTLKNAFSGDVTGTEAFKNAYKAKFKVVKDCKGTTAYGGTGAGVSSEGCWSATNKWYYLYGSSRGVLSNPGLILNDGAFVYFYMISSSCSNSLGDILRCGTIAVDVNGFKPPNTIGKDIYYMSVTSNSTIPHGSRTNNDPTVTCIEGSTASTNTGYGCSSKNLLE